MRNHAVLYIAVLLSILAVAATASAKDRLWIAKQAAQEHAARSTSDDGYAAPQVTAQNDIKGQRLWEARQQAREAADMAGDNYGIAGMPDTDPALNQNPLVCDTVPGYTLFQVRHYGRASETGGNC